MTHWWGGNPHSVEPMEVDESIYEEEQIEEPEIDDMVHYCPDCERPNQFGELCNECARERGELA